MRKIIWMIGLMMVMSIISMSSVNALTIEPGVDIHGSASNTEYIVNTNLGIETLVVDENAMYINNGILMIEPDSGCLTVRINELTQQNIEFGVATTGSVETVTFIIGGLTPWNIYWVYVDGVRWDYVTVNSNGTMEFDYSGWSEHTIVIDLVDQTTERVWLLTSIVTSVLLLVLVVVVLKGMFVSLNRSLGRNS